MRNQSVLLDFLQFFILWPLVLFFGGAGVAVWQGWENTNSIQEALNSKWILIYGGGMLVAYVVAVFRTLVEILRRAFRSGGTH